jgi:hypothetical protein
VEHRSGVDTTLYALVDPDFIPKWAISISFSGIVVSTGCYLATEFALRPIAAQALEAGPPPRRFAPGVMGRTVELVPGLVEVEVAVPRSRPAVW